MDRAGSALALGWLVIWLLSDGMLQSVPILQRVFYSNQPTSYYGFCVTGTYFSDEIHPFTTL